jgi:predicted MPP superfamily phosphohydrolase
VTFVPTPFWALHFLIDAAVVAGAWLLAGRLVRLKTPGSPLAEFRLVVAGVLGAAALWLPIVLAARGILGFCLAARVTWTTATVAGPVCAMAFAFRRRAPWAAAIALALVGVKYYGEVYEPNALEVQRLEVPVRGLAAPVKIAHLSDVQNDRFGALQERVRAEANAFAPDLVLFTGDALNHASLVPEASRWLSGFTAGAGKFFVTGDVDGAYDARALMAAGGFRVLDRDAVEVRVGRARLGLFGIPVGDAFDGERLRELSARLTVPRLLMSHRPDAALVLPPGAADVVLSGHTHGGQVCLPFFGPVVTLTRVPRDVAAGGLHAIAGVPIVVSRGLGWEGHIAPRVRAFCRPHLVLVTLVPA